MRIASIPRDFLSQLKRVGSVVRTSQFTSLVGGADEDDENPFEVPCRN
jgi:hypothetical protein